jgi:NAD(P)H-quinone oxidoreductase subunit 5
VKPICPFIREDLRMPDLDSITRILGIIVIAVPTALMMFLGLASLLNRKLSESTIVKVSQMAIVIGLAAAVSVLAVMLIEDTQHVAVDLGNWVAIPHYHFYVKIVFDRLSVPLAILTFVLCGTIGTFASKYMHREPGFNRFFTLFSFFFAGMIIASLAGTIETLFAGWELVGLSSALLIAFFQERPAPARNGFRVWVVYRFSDAALLLAAIVMHHMSGEGDFDKLLGGAKPWPDGETTVSERQALIVGFLLVIAAAGKSALVPFSSWLPRAMEGPTPSSAVFYGALSVHLGAFLLLRVSPLIDRSVTLAVIVVSLGLITALFASLAGSVQTDIKSALSFASVAQVGIIVAEIGLGFRYIPLVHMLGHACLRTLQFIRAPSLLQDYRILENAIGARLPGSAPSWIRLLPEKTRIWLYRLALERGYFDAMLNAFIVVPFVRFFRWFDVLERKWTDFLSGRASRETPVVPQASNQIEELP